MVFLKEVFQEMKRNIYQCDHIGLYTNNAEKLVNFYTKNLAFKKVKEERLGKSIFKKIFGIPVDCHFIRLASDNILLEIFEPTKGRASKKMKNSIGLNHWGYCVGNKKRFVQLLRRRRVKVIEIIRNGHEVYFVTDPDGNRIEIRDCRK